MNTSQHPPVFFISHGAPTFALEPALLGPMLRAQGEPLNNIKAVLVVSPHWQTQNIKVMTAAKPATVHDFGGFPPALYQIQYPAKGHADAAHDAMRLLQDAGFEVSIDDQRGRDHGAWVPMMHLFPNADVPVFQVSMPYSLTAQDAFKMGQALAPLRAQGVLIVGSGSLTHNLYEVGQFPDADAPYVIAFRDWIRQQIELNTPNALAQLIDYRRNAPDAVRAHPTEEHFLPLLVALGARSVDDAMLYLDGGIEYGMLAMDTYVWGADSH